MRLIDLTGKTFGRLRVTGRGSGVRGANGSAVVMWQCVCECGARVERRGANLRSGNTASCGCLALDIRTAHGLSRHPLYNRWNSMMRRCYEPTHHKFQRYGGRGVKVYSAWHDVAEYVRYVESLGPAPDGWTLDRIDNDGDYEPGNVRWADPSTQNLNRGAYNVHTKKQINEGMAA